MHFTKKPEYKIVTQWMGVKGRNPFQFQKEAWEQIYLGNSGLVNDATVF